MLSISENVSQEIKKIVERCSFDPWIGTPLEGYYKLSPSNMGEVGEILISDYMTMNLNSIVQDRTDPGHDRIVDGYKVEMKFSAAGRDLNKQKIKKSEFVINHIAVSKDWDRLVFFGINPNDEDSLRLFFSKKDFIENIKYLFDSKILRKQQSGKNGGNDDYMIPNTQAKKLFYLDWVYPIENWHDTNASCNKNLSEGLW